jgi:diguanylate cyclase (GGDEF)-like protein/PAS domain S-box-containing protein
MSPAVLVVDDDAGTGAALEQLFTRHGYRVHVCGSGADVLVATAQQRPDLILLDIRLPGIGGIETCRRLKAGDATRHIPVVFMTALAAAEEKLAGIEAGAVDFVTKPFDAAEVLARVHAHVAMRAMQRERMAHEAALRSEMAARERIEEAFKHTRHELSAILDNAPVAIFFTRDRRLVQYNRKFADMFAAEGERGIGELARRCYRSDEEYEALGRIAAPLLSQGKPFQTEMYLRRWDGDDFWGNVIGYVVNPQNTSEGTIWIVEDRSAQKRADESLKDTRDELTTILENASVGILFTRARVVQRCNQRLLEIFGYRIPGDLIGKPALVLFPDEQSYEHIGREAGSLLGAGQSFRADWLFCRADGSPVWCRVYAKAFDPRDTSRGTVWIIEDIGKVKRTEEALHRTLREMEAIMHNAPVGIAFTHDRRLVRYNAKFAEMFGFVGDRGIGLPGRVIYRSDADYEATGQVAAPLLSAGRPFQTEMYLRRQDGSDFWASVTGYVQNVADTGEGTIWIIEDRSATKRAEEQIYRLNAELERRVAERTTQLLRANADLQAEMTARERMEYAAQHDPLTGLPNRLLFEHDVAHAIVQARRDRRRLALLFLDMDGFKHVNDTLGHEVGDRVLQAMAKRLQACLREGDDVARFGGDEFVVSLPSLVDGQDAMPIAAKLLDALRAPLPIGQHEVHLSGSIGISLYPIDGEDIESLLRAADAAMYRAKQQGRNHARFFADAMNAGARSRQAIAQRLRRALEGEQLTLDYQPQVDLASGTVCAAEALIRWRDAELGAVSAVELIAVAEETGLIEPLGEWILRQACAQLRRWRSEGHTHMRIAVNLSPHQFRHGNFPDAAARILRETQVPAAAVMLELTEGTLMMRSTETVPVLEQLAAMGLQVAEDDFGTGYSSLSNLQRLPVHTLKIDGSMIRAIGKDARSTAAVAAIIAMAQRLDLKVVAEGVETAEQAAFLRTQRCEAAQGFYFSAPVGAAAVSALLRGGGRELERPSSSAPH